MSDGALDGGQALVSAGPFTEREMGGDNAMLPGQSQSHDSRWSGGCSWFSPY